MPRPIRLSLEKLELALKHPFTIARSTSTHKSNVLLRAAWGDHEGLGEGSYTPRYGQDAAGLAQALNRAVAELDGRCETPEELRARAFALEMPSGARMAFSIALADLEARVRGVPVHALFDLPAPPPTVTSFTIGLDERAAVERKVLEASAFSVLKVKAGRADDVELVSAVRALFAGPIRVDANEGWSVEDAPARLAAMAELRAELVEQPIPAGQYEALGRLKALTRVPLFVDEDLVTGDELEALIPVVHGINVKLMKCGSLERAVDVMRRARASGLKVMIGCMIESSIAITAAAHLLALADFADLDGHLLVNNDPWRGVSVEGGRLVLPAARTGLGVVRAGGMS